MAGVYVAAIDKGFEFTIQGEYKQLVCIHFQ